MNGIYPACHRWSGPPAFNSSEISTHCPILEDFLPQHPQTNPSTIQNRSLRSNTAAPNTPLWHRPEYIEPGLTVYVFRIDIHRHIVVCVKCCMCSARYRTYIPTRCIYVILCVPNRVRGLFFSTPYTLHINTDFNLGRVGLFYRKTQSSRVFVGIMFITTTETESKFKFESSTQQSSLFISNLSVI